MAGVEWIVWSLLLTLGAAMSLCSGLFFPQTLEKEKKNCKRSHMVFWQPVNQIPPFFSTNVSNYYFAYRYGVCFLQVMSNLGVVCYHMRIYLMLLTPWCYVVIPPRVFYDSVERKMVEGFVLITVPCVKIMESEKLGIYLFSAWQIWNYETLMWFALTIHGCIEPGGPLHVSWGNFRTHFHF